MENRFLIDTHIFIWSMEKNKRLSEKIFNILKNPQNSIYLSVATVWEMVIKVKRRKLKMPENIEAVINAAGFHILPIEINHVLNVRTLPSHHFDPFDRILIAQSMIENLTLITSDPKIWQYKIDLLKV